VQYDDKMYSMDKTMNWSQVLVCLFLQAESYDVPVITVYLKRVPRL